MGDRYTIKHCDGKASRITAELKAPPSQYTRGADGKPIPNAGAYYVDRSNGGFALARMSASGGDRNIFLARTARDFCDKADAFIEGVYAARAGGAK